MVTKLNKNVLMVQDVPSNLIEEAILILRTENNIIKDKTKELLMAEAKEIIDDCSMKLQAEYDMKKLAERRALDRKKRIKVNIIAATVVSLILIISILLIKIY